ALDQWARRSRQQALQQRPEHKVRREMFLGDLPSRDAVTVVVALQLLETGDHVVGVGEGEQPRPDGQAPPEAGVLGQYRPTAGEVARTAVAEPAGSGRDVAQLGQPELRP